MAKVLDIVILNIQESILNHIPANIVASIADKRKKRLTKRSLGIKEMKEIKELAEVERIDRRDRRDRRDRIERMTRRGSPLRERSVTRRHTILLSTLRLK